MSSSSGPLNEELQCSICLDVFTDPVTTPCGHNFCRTCLNKCWTNTQIRFCPLCKETFSRRPDLKINTTLREVVQHFKEKLNLGISEVFCDICDERKQKARNTKEEKSASVELFTDLIRSIERCQSELLKMMEEQQKAAEKQAEDLIKELQQEITDLKRRNTELEQLSHTDDHLHLLQISIDSDVNVYSLKNVLIQLEKTLDGTLNKKFCQSGIICFLSVDVTLDPDTANPYLILSDDGKQVSDGNFKQDVPENPKRFDDCSCILAKQGFSSGRFYYEVQVKGKTGWSLGVARESIKRKGTITLTPENGFWTVILRNENQYTACDNPPVSFSLKVKPEKVGVFVDYEEGLVSFYDVGSSSHIYSLTGQTFTEKLYPYFSPCHNNEGRNSNPLIISPVN
uniref:E3 ubiquitin-protein ligase TRIM39-like n=1 Tax=Sinocyclocheilus grahami TaxID=75366 RepID=A0A672NDP2_SINGR